MFFVLGIGGNLLCGFQISVINYPSMRFINETWLERYSSPLHQESLTLLWSLIVSIYCVGGLVGCLCIGYLSEKYGKKKCLLFNCLLIIVAALHVGFSKPAKSFEMILIGRALYGLSAGVCLNVHIQYAGEISPKKLRGFHHPFLDCQILSLNPQKTLEFQMSNWCPHFSLYKENPRPSVSSCGSH
uniref:Major facilitator superfamily (MFS) profile domain-containing protein n=1 Tax=Crocodylus porosus TaxID=8502 RepID=A0A7M4DZR3_CROPO